MIRRCLCHIAIEHGINSIKISYISGYTEEVLIKE